MIATLRGDLGGIVGPSGSGPTHATAGTLAFADLTGSITGLDSIWSINATGWLGTSAAEQVASTRGSIPDGLRRRRDGADGPESGRGRPGLTLTVGAGGVTGPSSPATWRCAVAGAVNVFEAAQLPTRSPRATPISCTSLHTARRTAPPAPEGAYVKELPP